jgi:hypothetical protein
MKTRKHLTTAKKCIVNNRPKKRKPILIMTSLNLIMFNKTKMMIENVEIPDQKNTKMQVESKSEIK